MTDDINIDCIQIISNPALVHAQSMSFLLSSGSNAQGQLGNGSLEDSHIFQKCSFGGYKHHTLPSGTSRVLDVATGANHTIVLLEIDGGRRELWGCGDDRKGQLGLKYQKEVQEGVSTTGFRKIELALKDYGLEEFSFKFIAASWETSYIVLSREGKADVVISMGSNDFGDLGVGPLPQSKKSQDDFHKVSFDHLTTPSGVHILPERMRVDAISTGQRHVIIHLDVSPASSTYLSEQVLVGWGNSRHGQLGPSTTTKPSPFTSTPRIIPLLTARDLITSSSLGIHHSVFLHRSRHISALGSDRKNQLQLIDTAKIVQSIGCTWNGTYAVVQDEGSDGRWYILSSGSNSHHQLGRGATTDSNSGRVEFPGTVDTKSTTVSIACGSEHILALIRDKSRTHSDVFGWGWNEHGNLGVGNTEDIPIPVQIWHSSEASNVQGIWAGYGTSWICVENLHEV